MRSATKSFAIKDGLCLIYPDRLECQYRGLRGRWLRWANRKGWVGQGGWYVLAALGFLGAVGLSIGINNWFLAFFFVVCALLALAAAWANRHATWQLVIDRKHIERVQYHPPIDGQARGSFLIDYRPGRRLRRRKISLPSLLQGGKEIANSAFWMMRDEGLIDS